MNRCFLSMLAVLLSGAAHASDVGEIFIWRAPLRGAWSNGAIYAVDVPLEVFDGSKAFPGDMRIRDEDRKEWPFYVVMAESRLYDSPWTAHLREQVEQMTPVRHLEALVTVGNRSDSNTSRHSRAAARMTGASYNRLVEIWGRTDASAWQWLGRGELSRRSDAPPSDQRTLSYDATSLTQLQFRIYPDTNNPGEGLVVNSIAILSEDGGADADWRAIAFQPADDADERDGVQTVLCDVGMKNIPLRQLRLDVGPGGMTCTMRVYGRHSPTNAWRWISDGAINRLDGQLRTVVNMRQTAFRFLKLDIHHLGQPPQQVLGVEVNPYHAQLVFQAGSGREPYLYFGAESYPLPRYDLQRRVGPTVPAVASAADLGERSRNPERIAAALRKYAGLLGRLVLLCLAGFALVLGVKYLRHRNG